jgi:hypothetical protein
VRRSLSVVALLVLLGLVTGVALQPDDGTPVTRPPSVGLEIDGANHAKPLPRLPSVVDLLPGLAVAVSALLVSVGSARPLRARRPFDDVTTVEIPRGLAPTRRGPPVPA